MHAAKGAVKYVEPDSTIFAVPELDASDAPSWGLAFARLTTTSLIGSCRLMTTPSPPRGSVPPGLIPRFVHGTSRATAPTAQARPPEPAMGLLPVQRSTPPKCCGTTEVASSPGHTR